METLKCSYLQYRCHVCGNTLYSEDYGIDDEGCVFLQISVCPVCLLAAAGAPQPDPERGRELPETLRHAAPTIKVEEEETTETTEEEEASRPENFDLRAEVKKDLCGWTWTAKPIGQHRNSYYFIDDGGTVRGTIYGRETIAQYLAVAWEQLDLFKAEMDEMQRMFSAERDDMKAQKTAAQLVASARSVGLARQEGQIEQIRRDCDNLKAERDAIAQHRDDLQSERDDLAVRLQSTWSGPRAPDP